MSDWPETRIGALAFDAVTFALIGVAAWHRRRRFRNQLTTLGSDDRKTWHALWRRWRFWPSGAGHVEVDEGAGELRLATYRLGWLGPLRTRRSHAVALADVRRVESGRMPLDWREAMASFWFAFFVSFWLHFVPCLWWQCDLGPADNGPVRGAIWFGGWALLAVILCLPSLRNEALVVETKRGDRWTVPASRAVAAALRARIGDT